MKYSKTRNKDKEYTMEDFTFIKKTAIKVAMTGVALVLLLNSFQVIEGGNRGVKITLGTIDETVLAEGVHLKVPFITTIKETSVRVEKTDVETEAASKDLQVLRVKTILSWQIVPEKVSYIYRKYGDIEQLKSRLILPEALSSIKTASSVRNAETLLQQRQAYEESIFNSLTQKLLKEGIVLNNINVGNIEFSEEFNNAIEAKQVAQQQAQQAFYLAEKAKNEAVALREKAKGEAGAEIERAKGSSEAEIERAKGSSQAEVERAKGAAEAQSLMAKTLTPEILQRDWIIKWDGKLPVTTVGDSSKLLVNVPQAR
jgi:regulator of protease activity HflC (stomatin/prohibitin superfamily)